FLTSVDEAMRVQQQIVRWLGGHWDGDAGDATSYVRRLEAKTLCREKRFDEAIAIARSDQKTLAEIVIDAPSSALNEDIVLATRLAAGYTSDLVAARILCRFGRNWDGAESAFARAVANNGGDPAVRAHRGLFFAAMRRFDEAERELRWANELCDAVMPERQLVTRGF